MRIQLLILGGIFSLCFSASATAPFPWAGSGMMSKGILYHQTNSAAPVMIESPFRFYAALIPDEGVPPIMLPNGEKRGVAPIVNGDLGYLSAWDYEDSAATKAQFDAEFPSGLYHFDDTSASDANGNVYNGPVPIELGPDAYPTIPRLLNWTDLHAVEAGLPLTLKWNAFQGGTTNDFVFLQILRATNSELLFSTEGILSTEALNGTMTQTTIPAGALPANESLRARLLFFRVTRGGIGNYGGWDPTPLAYSILDGAGRFGRFSGYFRQSETPLITLTEPPAEGRIQFASSSFAVNEARTEAVITVTRSGGVGTDYVYFNTTNGTANSSENNTGNVTATNAQDYVALSGTIVFEEGVTSTNVVIELRDDFHLEGNETVSLNLSLPVGGAELGIRSNAVLTIVDNESAAAGILQFKAANISVPELSKVARFEVIRTGGSTGTVSARYTATAGSATDGRDFFVTNGVVRFGPGETSKVVLVNLKDDAIDETNETFSVSLSELTGGARIGKNRMSRATIVDNDQPGVISFASARFLASESRGLFNITVIRTGGNSPVSVNYSTAFGKATDGDFTPASGTIFFGANQTSQKFEIVITNDPLVEGNEGFAVLLRNATGGATLGTARTVVTILDDGDVAPVGVVNTILIPPYIPPYEEEVPSGGGLIRTILGPQRNPAPPPNGF